MDRYTRETKVWLDGRYRQSSAEGIYIAHQPIYGFRRGFCEAARLGRYSIAYEILRAVAMIPGQSLLDVGGAEGYKCHLISKFAGIKVRNSDVSGEACRRAEEIFHFESDEVDVHSLPYGDGEFDVVLSSECIEHVTDYRAAVAELVRVAKDCVIITVPHDRLEFIERSITTRVPHAHLHAFDVDSFSYLEEEGLQVHARKLMHPFVTWLSPCVEATRKEWSGSHPRVAYTVYNALVPIFRLLFGIRAADFLIGIDATLCRLTGHYGGILFIILKPGVQPYDMPRFEIGPREMLEVCVPLHRIPVEATS